MRNRRRSHSLQPVNRASIVDPQSEDNPSLVSTTNLAQVLLLQTTDRHPLSSSSSSSSPAPSLERSPPVSQRTTSRPNIAPPPPPRPPPYTPRHISSRFEHFRLPSCILNEAASPPPTEQTLQRLLHRLIPDPTNYRPRRSPLRFEPTRTVNENIDLIDDVKKLIIQASELHQDIEIKLTRIQLQLLRQDFERQDGTNHSTNLQ
jgi:hypothetical protein